jgi:hypothetical protein
LWFVVELYIGLSDLVLNSVGDPEREQVDECMRDFEGKRDGNEYLEEKKKCIAKFDGEDNLKILPRIRLLVDERICDVDALCDDDDPSPCRDSGNPADPKSFQPGNVTQCYHLIDQTKFEKDLKKKDLINEQVRKRCTGDNVWSKYENEVQLKYCMWKHQASGVCTNSLRTTCPSEGTCCPEAQNDPISGDNSRKDQYQCMKSPVVGLYCQHVKYTVIGVKPSQLCTDVTCSTFAWCRDFADIPNLCLGEACKDYQQVKVVAAICIGLVAIALILDIVDVCFFCKCQTSQTTKTLLNLFASCIKLFTYLLCIAGGVSEFMDTVIEKQCYNDDGVTMINEVSDSLRDFLLTTILSCFGSLFLAPFSIWWGGKLSGVPYARIRGGG